jgi:hypothetical protein
VQKAKQHKKKSLENYLLNGLKENAFLNGDCFANFGFLTSVWRQDDVMCKIHIHTHAARKIYGESNKCLPNRKR